MKSEIHKRHKKHKHRHCSPVPSEENAQSEQENDSDSSSSHEYVSSNSKKQRHKEKSSSRTRAEGSRHHRKKHKTHDHAYESIDQVRVKEEPLSSDDDHIHGNSDVSLGRNRSNDRREGERRHRTTATEVKETLGKHKSNYVHDKSTKHDNRNGRTNIRNNRENQVDGGPSSKRSKSDNRDRPQIRSDAGGRSQESRHCERARDRGDHRNQRNRNTVSVKKEPHGEGEGEYEWGRKTESTSAARAPPAEKQKPNFGLSGKLTEDTNTFNGVVIKYSEPPESRKPKRRWRFYPFKGDQGLPTLYIHRQSAYLIGRDRKVVDIPVDHPSCSKQHAALQYRLVPFTRENGTIGKRVRPYIIDLESANGTYVNNVKIEPRKYVELMERDVLKFGYSSRDYVLLHEHSKGDESDEEVGAE